MADKLSGSGKKKIGHQRARHAGEPAKRNPRVSRKTVKQRRAPNLKKKKMTTKRVPTPFEALSYSVYRGGVEAPGGERAQPVELKK